MFWNYLTLLQEIRLSDLLDIFLASGFFWFGFHTLRTERTRRIGVGLLLYSFIFLLANQLELKLSLWVLKGLTAVIVLVVVVVYQNEIRRLLERFPASFFYRSRMSHKESTGLADLLTDVLDILSHENRGALIVLPGLAPLEGLITPGVLLNGEISKSLLLSLFDPNSPGHDGALVVWGNRVERFGSRLPLSEQDNQLKEKGTRHAAALGLSEKTDAMVLIVSEESGRISVAREGILSPAIDRVCLRKDIEKFLEGHSTQEPNQSRLKSLKLMMVFESISALLVASILWLVLVPGSVVENSTYVVPIEVQNIPEGFTLQSVTPSTISITLSGEKRNLFKINPDDLLIRLDGTLSSLGRQTYPITSAHLLLPPDVEVFDLAPEQVKVLVRKLN